jgi:hypothetical protein
MMAAGEIKELKIEIGVLEGEEELREFVTKIRSIQAAL